MANFQCKILNGFSTLSMAGNFASTVFVMSVLKLGDQVESNPKLSTCLEMVKCQDKEWNLKNGIGWLIHLYIILALVFVFFYRCEFRQRKDKEEEGQKEAKTVFLE